MLSPCLAVWVHKYGKRKLKILMGVKYTAECVLYGVFQIGEVFSLKFCNLGKQNGTCIRHRLIQKTVGVNNSCLNTFSSAYKCFW